MSLQTRIERLHAQRMAEMRARSEAAARISPTEGAARLAHLYVTGHARVRELLDLARQRQAFGDLA